MWRCSRQSKARAAERSDADAFDGAQAKTCKPHCAREGNIKLAVLLLKGCELARPSACSRAPRRLRIGSRARHAIGRSRSRVARLRCARRAFSTDLFALWPRQLLFQFSSAARVIAASSASIRPTRFQFFDRNHSVSLRYGSLTSRLGRLSIVLHRGRDRLVRRTSRWKGKNEVE